MKHVASTALIHSLAKITMSRSIYFKLYTILVDQWLIHYRDFDRGQETKKKQKQQKREI
jgi:hypothetical protein